jgi:hypothetical protein
VAELNDLLIRILVVHQDKYHKSFNCYIIILYLIQTEIMNFEILDKVIIKHILVRCTLTHIFEDGSIGRFLITGYFNSMLISMQCKSFIQKRKI